MTILASWDGEHFVPYGRYAKQCDRDYVVGQMYTLDVVLERSDNSHRHYFAAVHEVWLNLPEPLASRFQTSEHLRKHALIQAGYYNERAIVCSTPEEATRFAAFVQPMDEYAIVVVNGYVVTQYTAKSQSYRDMDKATFQHSKEKVLEIISDMIGVTLQQLEKATS